MRGSFDEAAFRRSVYAVAHSVASPGYTTLEKLWTRPTCEVNGLLGYTGEGATVTTGKVDGESELPAAGARSGLRHDPQVAGGACARGRPAGVTVTVTPLRGGLLRGGPISPPLLRCGVARTRDRLRA